MAHTQSGHSWLLAASDSALGIVTMMALLLNRQSLNGFHLIV